MATSLNIRLDDHAEKVLENVLKHLGTTNASQAMRGALYIYNYVLEMQERGYDLIAVTPASIKEQHIAVAIPMQTSRGSSPSLSTPRLL